MRLAKHVGFAYNARSDEDGIDGSIEFGVSGR